MRVWGWKATIFSNARTTGFSRRASVSVLTETIGRPAIVTHGVRWTMPIRNGGIVAVQWCNVRSCSDPAAEARDCCLVPILMD